MQAHRLQDLMWAAKPVCCTRRHHLPDCVTLLQVLSIAREMRRASKRPPHLPPALIRLDHHPLLHFHNLATTLCQLLDLYPHLVVPE
jgi:hypothetical protein